MPAVIDIFMERLTLAPLARPPPPPPFHIDGLVQDCSNSIVNALELLQVCTKLSMYSAAHYALFDVT